MGTCRFEGCRGEDGRKCGEQPGQGRSLGQSADRTGAHDGRGWGPGGGRRIARITRIRHAGSLREAPPDLDRSGTP